MIVNNIKNIKEISDNICKVNVNVKKRTKIIDETMNEDIQEIVVDETRVLLRKNTIDDEFVLKKINVLHQDHEKSFIVINYSSFDCYRLTDVFSFHSAETETETTDAAEWRQPALVTFSRDPVSQMIVDDSNMNDIDVLLKKYDRAQTKLLWFDLDVHDQNRVQKETQIYVNVSSLNFSVSARFSRVISSDIISRMSRILIKRRFKILIVSKIDEFSRNRQAVMNDDDDEEFNVNDDNCSNCIRCCCISINCRRC